MATTDGFFMVGRAEPRRRIETAIAASAEGQRRTVLVSGEAGMGKTTLIRSSLAEAPDEPAVGWGTCWHGGGAPSFWPWMQAFDDLVSAVGHDAAVRAAGHDRELLAAVARPLGTSSRNATVSEGDRILLLDAIVRWLETLSADRQVLVVLDDLQWADPSSLDLLDLLTGTGSPAKLLIIGGYRHDDLDEDRRPRLARLAGRCERVRLSGLTAPEVAALAARVVGSALTTKELAALHSRTGGHPLFVTELARLTALGDDTLPEVVTDAVARRLDSMEDATRGALDAASVLGNQVLIDVIAHATDASIESTAAAIDHALRAGVIRAGSNSTLWFTHDLFRETLYASLDRSRRTALHAAIAAALEARADRGGQVQAGDLARHHADAVSITGVEPVIRWARLAAAEERQRSAFREAAFQITRARTSAMDAGLAIEPTTLVDLLLAEAADTARAGSPDLARSILHSAASVAPGPAERADVALAVQRLGAAFAVRRDEIIIQLDQALGGVIGTDRIREARVTAALARELQHSVPEDRARAAPLSETALALGRSVGDDSTLTDCLLARHDVLWGPGTGAERAELGQEIAEIGARLHDADRHAEGLLLQANGLLESGSAGYRPILDRWFATLEKRDQPRDRYMVLTRRAALALIEGDTVAADSLMHEAAVVGATIHEPDTGNVLMSHRVAFAMALDDPAEHRRLAADAVAHWTGTPVHAHSVAAGALTAAGDLDSAAREVAMVADSGGWSSEGSYLRSVLVAHLAAAAVALEDLPLCRELLEEVEPLTGHCGVNGAVVAFAGPFDHTAGILAAAIGDQDRAEFLLKRSITTSSRIGAVVWEHAGERALAVLSNAHNGSNTLRTEPATLQRTGGIWSVEWRGESGNVRHVKGLADIAQLVSRPHSEIPAIALANPEAVDSQSSEAVIDLDALAAYRTRLDHLDRELDEADAHNDAGRVERLQSEREALLAEVRKSTGLGGRVRTVANDPSERARKAVSARIRDAITRIETVAPQLGAHLDRSIRTGLRCSYQPTPDDRIEWRITDQ